MTRDLPAGRLLVADVDASGEAAGRMLLERLAPTAAALAADEAVTIDLDWATIRLRASGARVVAEEPGYGRDGGGFEASLAATAAISAAQARLTAALHVVPEPVTALQFVQVSAAAMQAASVVGHRRDDERDPFTGWTIVATTDVLDEAEFGYYTVRELAHRRPAWIVALNLPRSWSFRFVGDTLVDCVSPGAETHPTNLTVPV